MIDNRTTHYPVIRINRAHISQTDSSSLKIRIDYSLNLRRPGFNGTTDAITNYLNTPEGKQGVNISFMVLDDRNESLIRDFFDYSSFAGTMLSRVNDDRFAALNESDGWQRIPLTEALRQSSDLELRTTVTDMGGETQYETYNFVEFEYRLHSFFAGLSPGQSIFQETSGTSLASLDNTTLKSGLHLVAFIEMPYLTYLQELANTPEELKSFPVTEMVYERLLQPTEFGALRPPKYRKIYFINDNNPDYSDINGLPYTGPAVFSSGAWRAGRDDQVGARLEVRNIPNTKISVDAPPLASESNIPALNHSLRQETGQDLEQYIKSNQDTSLFLSEARMAQLMVKNSISAMSAKKNAFIEPWSYRHTWITTVDEEREGQLGSSYNCIFGIKYYDLIKNNTAFGGLLDYHYGLDGERSKRIVADIYKKTKIMNMRVIRRRLSHDAYDNNDQCAPTHADFEKNQSNPVIIQTADSQVPDADFLTAGIQKAQNTRASIEEVRLSLDGQTEEDTINELTQEEIEQGTFVMKSDLLTRSFMLKDYELYYNLDHGKYTYDVEVIIKDGSRELVEEYIASLKRAIRGYSNQLSYLSAAIVRNPAGEIEQIRNPAGEIVQTGLYDYQIRKFFGVSNGDGLAFKGRVVRLLHDINSSVYFLTGKVPFPGTTGNPGSRFYEVVSKLDPRFSTTRIEDMEYFKHQSTKVLSSLEELLESAFLKQKSPKPSSYVEVHVPNASANNASIIFAKAKTGIIQNAEDTSKLVTDFGLSGELEQFLTRARAEIFSGELQSDLPETPPISQEFPTPYGDIVPPIRSEIDFNLEYMEPLSFLTLNVPRLDISLPLFDPSAGRLDLETTLDPVINPVRKPMNSFENTFAPAAAPYTTSRAAVRVTKMDFISSNPVQKSVKENKILALASPGSHLIGLASKDPAFDARHIPSSVGNVDVHFGGKAFNSDYREVAKFAIQKLPLQLAALTDDLKKTIIDELIDSSDAEEFTTRIEDNYKELSDMRDNLGDVYSMFNRLMSLGDFAVKTSAFSKTQEARFKLGLQKDTTEITSEYNKDPFQKKRANLVSFNINGDTTRHSSMTKGVQSFRTKQTKSRKTKIKEVKLFKLEVDAAADNIATVNNAILVERL